MARHLGRDFRPGEDFARDIHVEEELLFLHRLAVVAQVDVSVLNVARLVAPRQAVLPVDKEPVNRQPVRVRQQVARRQFHRQCAKVAVEQQVAQRQLQRRSRFRGRADFDPDR